MELIVFDLDGTLLNRKSEISDYTSETLKLLAEKGIAYTVATGRAMHSAQAILADHRFLLPQAYKNGVMIWHPETERFLSGATLTPGELDNVVRACLTQRLTPFVFTLDEDAGSTVYHSPTLTDIERGLIRSIGVEASVAVRALDELPADATITHVNAIGDGDAINAVLRSVNDEPHMVGKGLFQSGDRRRQPRVGLPAGHDRQHQAGSPCQQVVEIETQPGRTQQRQPGEPVAGMQQRPGQGAQVANDRSLRQRVDIDCLKADSGRPQGRGDCAQVTARPGQNRNASVRVAVECLSYEFDNQRCLRLRLLAGKGVDLDGVVVAVRIVWIGRRVGHCPACRVDSRCQDRGKGVVEPVDDLL